MADAVAMPLLLDLDARRSDALDAIAKATQRDRVAVIGEAIDAYIELHNWQLEHIKEGVRQADAGEFASPEELAEFFTLKS